jgi:hypothetical protein
MSSTPSRPVVGSRTPIYVPPTPAPPVPAVQKDKGYFLIRVHAAQASYTGGFWTNLRNAVKQVIVTSQVQVHPGAEEAIRHLQVSRRIRPGQAVELGLRSNFTDWIPTVVDKIAIDLAFVLDREDRLGAIASAINGSQLLSTLSLAEPALATARALGTATKVILDGFLAPESKTPILEFKGDFNVGTQDLRAGHYVLLGTVDAATPLPGEGAAYAVREGKLEVNGAPADAWSYVILEVLCTPVRGRNRSAQWDRLLQQAEAAAADYARVIEPTAGQKKAAMDQCRTLIAQADALSRGDPTFTPDEAGKIVAAVFKECRDTILAPGGPDSRAAAGADTADWAATRRSLGLGEDEGQLEAGVAAYHGQLSTYRQVEQLRAEKDRQSEETRQVAEALEAVPG